MPTDFDHLADEIEQLAAQPAGGLWFDEVAAVATRVRQQVSTDEPARDRHADIVVEAPRLVGTVSQLDARRARVDHLVALLHVLATGTLRSADATQVLLRQLALQLRSLEHRHRRVVFDAVTVDIGGTG